MKKNLLFSIVLMASFVSCAQTKGTVTLYGYKQPVTPGTIPARAIDEEGKEIATERRQRFNYLIYLTSAATVHPSEVWVNGKPFAATTTVIKNTPVTQAGTTSDSSKVLVPKTNRRVIQVDLAPAVDTKMSAMGKTQSAKNELVIVYKSGGKFYYQVLSKFTMLDAVEMQ